MARGETKILGDKAIIFLNDHDIWQFRCWVSDEKKYVRQSLKTKDKDQAIDLAEELYLDVHARVRSGKKIFGAPIIEAIQPFLDHKKSQIGVGDKYTIVQGRYDTIATHLRHLVRYLGKNTKITDLDGNFLNRWEADGERQSYLLFRKDEGASDSTITNEISTITAAFTWLYDEGHHNIRKIKKPEATKSQHDIDNEKVQRETFSYPEYKKWTTALSRSYVAPVSVKNNVSAEEWYDRQLARHYFLFAANSGMRSGELRKLKWEDVKIEVVGGGNTEEVMLARVQVRARTTKVRKSRTFFCVGGLYLKRWGNEFAKHKSGIIFSRDGKNELSNSFFHKHFRRVLNLTDIEKERKDQLVPYSLRHFLITQRFMAGVRYEDIANMCGSSVKTVERTYIHLNEEIMKRTALAKYTVRDGIAVPLVNLLDETLV